MSDDLLDDLEHSLTPPDAMHSHLAAAVACHVVDRLAVPNNEKLAQRIGRLLDALCDGGGHGALKLARWLAVEGGANANDRALIRNHAHTLIGSVLVEDEPKVPDWVDHLLGPLLYEAHTDGLIVVLHRLGVGR